MKKGLIAAAVIILAATSSVANAATTEIKLSVTGNTAVAATPPPVVLSAFRVMFGNVPVQQWKQRSNNQWRAHFIRNGVAWEATFTSTGVLVKSERA
jgi:hypothetical protein